MHVAKLAALAVLLASSAHAQIPLFDCTLLFPLDCGFQEQAKVPGRATVVFAPTRAGSTAVRLHTEPGDRDVDGSGISERNDLWLTQELTDGYEGRDQWWAHSFYLPDDFQAPTWHQYVFADFHHTNPTGQANFHVQSCRVPGNDSEPGRLCFVGFGGQQDGGRYEADIGPIVKNQWYDFVYHVRWSSGPGGFFDAWVNGRRVLAHQGPTLYTGQGVYLKLANYHLPICDPFPACIGTHRASSVIHDRILRGSTWQSVSDRPLEGLDEPTPKLPKAPMAVTATQ